MIYRLISLVTLVSVMAGCAFSPEDFQRLAQQGAVQDSGLAVEDTSAPVDISSSVVIGEKVSLQEPAVPVEMAAATPTKVKPTPTVLVPSATPTKPPALLGPDEFSPGINPLTGLPVQDAAALNYSPALVSITNFPVSARPQAGLSYSPFVFEMYIGEGMTRFLALFYGDYPQKATTEETGIALEDDRIGPVRSGRLPYESLRQLYNGFLVMASASPNVKSSLNSFTNVWGSDTGDINSAMIPATKLEEIASVNPDRVNVEMLSGLHFDQASPDGGKLAKKIWIPFSFLNQVFWKYDSTTSSYLRFQDNADGETFIQATDRLNQQALTYENVVILFAMHEAQRETLIDINLMYIDRLPALLFRDGKMYEIYWTTANSNYEKTTGKVRPIRFIDAEGNPFPLKPGQTWVEIVQTFTAYNETVESEKYLEMKTKTSPGSGNWVIHFYPTVADR